MTFLPRPLEMPSAGVSARVPAPHDAAGHLAALQADALPLDPRRWSRAEVARWVSRAGGRPDRFPMNGKALCLMSEDMFAARVPARGRALHRDFRRRLAKALVLQDFLEKMSAN